jgi:hypothetical protein
MKDLPPAEIRKERREPGMLTTSGSICKQLDSQFVDQQTKNLSGFLGST